MPSTPRWGGLRPEPYDPDARDADGDGIVQEGTAFERPFGTRILDQLGRDIIKGSNLLSRDGLQYRDRNNQPVMVNGVPYAPQAVSLQSSETALGRIGHATIGGQLGTISNPAPPPVSEIVPPAPRRGPDWLYHTKTVKVKDKAILKDRKTKKRFGLLLDEIANIHGVGDDANPVFIELRKSKGERAGGTFYRKGEDGFSMPSLWASANTVKGGEDPDYINVLHEMGHWLDSPSGTYVSSMSVNKFGGDYSLPEMNTFLQGATIDSPHYIQVTQSLHAGQDQAYNEYFHSVHEVWARAYSQYMARELERSGSPLGVQIGQALNGYQARNPDYTWPDDEFAEHIAPLVEDVLRARGLLNGSAREESGIRQGISEINPPLPEGPNAALTQLPSTTEPRTLTPLPYEIGTNPHPISAESKQRAITHREEATKDSIKTKFKKLFGMGDADGYPSSIEADSLDKPATIKSSIREDLLWRRRKKTDIDINPDGLADDMWIGKDGTSISRQELLQNMMDQAGANSPEELTDWINAEAEKRRKLDFENAHTSRTIISVPSKDLEEIVKDGHYKSQAERASEAGSEEVSGGAKQAIEEAQMGVPVDLDPTKRPIYGHKDMTEEGESLGDLPGASYSDREGGGFHLVLKEEANATTTVSFGDTANTGVIPTGSNTLDEHRLDLADAGSKVVDHHASEVLSELQQAALSDLSAENPDDIAEVLGDKLKIVHPQKAEYWEAQVHGGVSLTDIDMLVIPDGFTPSERFSPAMLEILKSNGIRIVSSSEYSSGIKSSASAAKTKSLIETKGLRPQLIVEPYDPDAQDGDGDGIVQEGTAFERPVGSRLIDEAGKDIVRGFTSISEMKLRTVDKDGNPVENKRIPRQPAGEAKEKVKGVLDAFSLAKRKSTLSSQGHRSIGTGLPKLESLGHKSVIDRVAPRPPKPAKVKKKLPSVRKKRSAHAPTAVLETYERDKARVAELHGDVSTADKAHAAISKAFPTLAMPFLFNGEAEWKAKPDAPLSPDERGWVTSLLVLADDHPEAAKALRVLSTDSMARHDMDEATNAFVTVQPMFSDNLEEEMHLFGALLAFNPDGSILPNSKKRRFGRKEKRLTGTANEEHIQDLLSSGQITVEQAHELTSAYTATHEFGHVIHFTQTIKDMGIDITDPTKNDENIVKFFEIGSKKKLDLPDPDIDTLDWRTAVDELLTSADDAFYAEWDRALNAASFDALTDNQVYDFLDSASGVSEYATTGVDEGLGYEAFAELFAAEKWGIAHQPDKYVGKMRDWTDVVVGEDNGAGPAQVFTRPEREASGDLQAALGRVNESATGPSRLSSTATGPRKVEIPERARDKIKRLLNLRHGSERDNSPRENTPEQEAIAKVLADDFFKVNGVSKHGNPWNTRIDSAELTDAVDHYDFGDDETIHHIIVMGTIIDSETGKPIGTFTRTIDLRDPKNPIVNNDSFQMNADQQHNGIGKSFLTQTLSNYHAGGIDKVTLQASSTRPVKSDNPANSANTGFTTWAKLGAERGGTYGIQGLDVGELERIIGKPSDEITADDIRAHWSSLVGLDLITDMTFDLSNGLPKELLSGASATKAASQKQQPISLEEWNSILDDYVPMSPEMELAQKRKRNRYQLCHRPDGQPGLPLVEYDYDREK